MEELDQQTLNQLRAGGWVPTRTERGLLARMARQYQLEGAADWRRRVVADYSETRKASPADLGGGDRRGSKNTESRMPPDTSLATPSEHEHVARHAAAVVASAASDLDDFYYRKRREGLLKIRVVKRATDERGPYEIWQLRFPRVKGEPLNERLSRAPIWLETPMVDDGSESEPEGIIRPGARKLAARCGWSEAQAARYLIYRKLPRPDPCVVRYATGFADDRTPVGRNITLLVHEGTSVATVTKEFARAAQRRGRPIATHTLEVVAFVDQLRASGIQPYSKEAMKQLRRKHPEWPIGSPSHLATVERRGRRALKRATGTGKPRRPR